jgi:uncharacterized membrane protein
MSPLERRALSTIVFLSFLSFFAVATANGAAYTVQVVEMTVFRDGLVHLEQEVTVDETVPEIFLPLLSSSIENIVVLDDDQKPVDYAFNGSSLTVFTLGATKVTLEYDTTALTKKEAEVWTLIADNPYNLTAFLPKNSTVIYLGGMPTGINTDGNGLALSLYPGHWEISYVLPLVPLEETDNSGPASFPMEYVYVATAASAGVVAAVAILLVRRKKPNVNRILKANPQLMPEDKEVLNFLAEKGGSAFEAEIRLRFPDKPRTSLWRLIRRLERLEIVEVKKVGLENQVLLRK